MSEFGKKSVNTRPSAEVKLIVGGDIGLRKALEELMGSIAKRGLMVRRKSAGSSGGTDESDPLSHVAVEVKLRPENHSPLIEEVVQLNEANKSSGGELIRGAKIRLDVMRFFYVTYGMSNPVHYMELLKTFLMANNVYIDSINPHTALLANLARTPLLINEGGRTGKYSIDKDALSRLYIKLHAAQEELTGLVHLTKQGDVSTELEIQIRNITNKVIKLKKNIAESEQILAPVKAEEITQASQ
jgi:hypothetical protein